MSDTHDHPRQTHRPRPPRRDHRHGPHTPEGSVRHRYDTRHRPRLSRHETHETGEYGPMRHPLRGGSDRVRVNRQTERARTTPNSDGGLGALRGPLRRSLRSRLLGRTSSRIPVRRLSRPLRAQQAHIRAHIQAPRQAHERRRPPRAPVGVCPPRERQGSMCSDVDVDHQTALRRLSLRVQTDGGAETETRDSTGDPPGHPPVSPPDQIHKFAGVSGVLLAEPSDKRGWYAW